MDSGIPAWILVPYIPLPAIRLPPRSIASHSPARLAPNSAGDGSGFERKCLREHDHGIINQTVASSGGFFSFVWRRNRIVQFFRPLLVKVLVEVDHDDDSIEIEN
jgi:hypothetical protein